MPNTLTSQFKGVATLTHEFVVHLGLHVQAWRDQKLHLRR